MTSTQTPAAPAATWTTHWTRLALAALPADLATATPPQVDEVIRTVQLDAAAIGARIDRAVLVIRKAIGQKATETHERTARGRRTVTEWPTTAVEAIAAARALDSATECADWQLRGYSNILTVADALAPFDALLAELADAEAIEARMHAEFTRRGGWARYYRVDNNNGHVHVSTSCRETYATTAFNWPTQLSGTDAQGVVDAAGPLTCLTCFPEVREQILTDRPVRFDAFETTEQRAARIEREEAAAARRAKKIRDGVTADGSPLVVREPYSSWDTDGRTHGRELKTARAAELCYIEFAAKAQLGRTSAAATATYLASAAQILDALAAKRETTVEALTESFAKKVAKKFENENW